MDLASRVAHAPTTALMEDIKTLGRVPQAKRGNDAESVPERNQASRLSKAREAGHVTDEYEAELTALGDASQLAHASTTALMEEIRTL